jgi:diphthamide biosynthesis methyltransferase
MPNWKEHTNKPKSYAEIIKQNQSIKAHTLILTDINLEISDAINQLNESISLEQKIIALEKAGTPNQKIYYDTPENLQASNIQMPFCLIISSDLNHIEQEALEILTIQ